MKPLLVSVSAFTVNNLKTGKNVRRARMAARIGLRELARAIGVDPSTLLRLEGGFGRWTPELVAKVEKEVYGE